MIPTLTETVIAGVITALANGIGGLPFVFVREFPITVARLGWSIAGGMMLSADRGFDRDGVIWDRLRAHWS
jgi:hypothetical protein